ncbi:hypothetical protein H7H78_11080 [Mycobacterium shinjukuense]|uniref:hypothetical protein n=1 Tax=Mycobacterium shinjukuense TaxID=398694 RepID=UPI0013D01792|nr:hypothetical protein [Mycobacterium shinjukuense]MCV6985954.1 hypothetical protein [Mycobacterium shinjukuense]
MVDGFAVASALSQDLPVLDPGDDVVNAGCDPAVRPVAVVADDACVGSAAGLVIDAEPR